MTFLILANMGIFAHFKASIQKIAIPHYGHKEMSVISGTALATTFIDLITAVGVFTFGYHLFNRYRKKQKALRDYVPG